LQEWADRDGVTRDQFYPWAWDQTLFEGSTYGIPHETDVSVLFWNKQLFEAAGLDPEQPPETCRIGFFPLWNRGVDVWQYTNDAEMIGPEGVVQINNPNMVETVEWIQSWVDRYGGWQKLQDFNAKFGAPPNDNFMSNGIAMPRMDWGIGLLPHDEDAKGGTWSGGFSMSIPTGSDNAEAAWEFIKCATGAEGQSSWARDTQAQPTNIAAAEDPVLQSNPTWQVVDDALAVSTGGNSLPAYPNWSEQLGQRYERIWTGELTPQQALDEAQAAVEAEIQ
jgi:multiple sugar transport system substrate-binding protein